MQRNSHIHWATFTSKIQPHMAIDVLCGYLNVEPEILDKGNRYYGRRADFGTLARVYWSGTVENEICIELTGTACEQLGTTTVLDLYNLFEAKCTRLDIATDGGNFTPRMVFEHLQCDRDSPMVGLRSRISKTGYDWHMSSKGDTLYLGSKESKRRLAIYDRNQDANGENFTRAELRFKKTAAEKVINLIEQDRSKFEYHAISLLRDFIDFVKDDNTNISRCSLADWWAEFVGNTSKTSIKYTDKTVSTIEKIVEYMLKNMPNFFVMVMAYVTKTGKGIEEICNKLLCEGVARAKKKHKDLIRYLDLNDLEKLTI